MEVTVADSGPCRRTLTIVIPAEEVQSHIDEVYKSASNQVNIKGFRPGKVPRKVLEKKFGDEILSEAKESLINRSFEEALREQELSPLGRPDVEGLDDSPLDSSKGLEFQVHVEVRPVFEVKSAKGLEVAAGTTDVTDEDVDNALQQLAGEKRTLQKVEEPVADGDFVKVDLAFKNEQGDVVSERKGVQLNTNIPVAGTDPETFGARLRGAEQGQNLDLEIEFPEGFEKEEVRGQKGTVEMAVHEVLRVIPAAIDDELAKGYDFENLDGMKEDLTRRLADEKVRANKARQEEELLNILIAENPFDLPEGMVAEQAKHGLREFEERLKQANMEEGEIKTRLETAEPEAREDAARRVRTFFLLDAVAKKEKIFVTEGDVDVELRNVAAQNNVSAGEVREYYEKHNLLADLRLGLMERKVRDFLRENAKLTD